MVKLRLRRTGSKKRAYYRVVVTPSTSSRDGKFIEIVGHYNPHDNPPSLVLQEDRVFHWLSVGAQLSDSLERIFKSKGILDKFEAYKADASTEEAPAEEAVAETA